MKNLMILRASLAGLLQGLQLRLLQELCQTPVLERAPHGEPVKSRSHFFACAGEASKTSIAWLLAVGSRRLMRMSRFAKRFPKRLQLLQRSCSFRGARARAIFRGARALPKRPLLLFYLLSDPITV